MEVQDEELVTLIEQHKLNWQTTHTDELVTLADQLSKSIWKREKDKPAKIMSLQLQQVSNQIRPQRSLRLGESFYYYYFYCFYYWKLGHFKKDCRKLKWDLEKEKKQKQAQGYDRVFPHLFINTLGEIKITIREAITKAFVDTGATLSVLNPNQVNCHLPQSTPSVQMVGISDQPVPVFIFYSFYVLHCSNYFPLCPPSPSPPTTSIVNPHTAVHVHGSFIYVL